jgi:hypothetical protein
VSLQRQLQLIIDDNYRLLYGGKQNEQNEFPKKRDNSELLLDSLGTHFANLQKAIIVVGGDF